jgi:hypothetical protein
MGQYFRPIILDDDGKPMRFFESHYYNDDYKLMEHSWMNEHYEAKGMVVAVESFLAMDAALPVIWSGDYDDEKLWNLCEPHMEVRFDDTTPPSYLSTPGVRVTAASHPFVVNVTRKEYVDKREVPRDDFGAIHPLPLLTVNSNGRGGGDYRGSWEHVGRWSDKSRIAVTATEPADPEYVKLDVSGLVE